MACHFIHARIHEVVRNTFAVEIADDVQPLNLAWSIGHNAAWCFAPAELCEPHQPSTKLAKQSNHVRVGNFFRLDRLAVSGSAVEIHVVRGVRGSKCVPERLFSDR